MQLRQYQQECIDIINKLKSGKYLVQMATGLGKTVTFANLPRKGRMLILSHREELVRQPLKYFTCQTGVEQAQYHASPWDEVVSASVQSMVRRLDRFSPDDFDIIVVDEAHHAAARTYRKIIDYFAPRLLLGFTATPNRADNVRLNDIFSQIIFKRDLRWGIKNNYLCDIFCRRVNIGYDLRKVKTSHGDYAPGELEKAMDGTEEAIAQAYHQLATGATLIFAVSVEHSEEIAKRIPGAVSVTAKTKDRAKIIKALTDGEIPCITSVGVFTEGTDIPRVETIIIARPTQSDSLYAQMVGRGLRLYPGKDRLNLIDCVGVTGRTSLCTAPSLLGIDLKDVPPKRQDEIEGMLFELPDRAARAADCPESWIRNVETVNLWAQAQKYNLHNVNWLRMPDGSLTCNLSEMKKHIRHVITIPCQDELGKTHYNGRYVDMQTAIDEAYQDLCNNYHDLRKIWDLDAIKRWGAGSATDKQLAYIQRRCKGYDPTGISKLQASQIISHLSAASAGKGRRT